VYFFAPFVAIAIAYGEQRVVYGGVYTIGAGDERYFYPTWMVAQSSDRPFIVHSCFSWTSFYNLFWVVCILVMQRLSVLKFVCVYQLDATC
jgi:hypothetical protein